MAIFIYQFIFCVIRVGRGLRLDSAKPYPLKRAVELGKLNRLTGMLIQCVLM